MIGHQVITWTNVDVSSKLFCGIHLGAISLEVLLNFSCNLCSEIVLETLRPPIPGANELKLMNAKQNWEHLLNDTKNQT